MKTHKDDEIVSSNEEIAALLGIKISKVFRLIDEGCMPKPFNEIKTGKKTFRQWHKKDILAIKPFIHLGKNELLAYLVTSLHNNVENQDFFDSIGNCKVKTGMNEKYSVKGLMREMLLRLFKEGECFEPQTPKGEKGFEVDVRDAIARGGFVPYEVDSDEDYVIEYDDEKVKQILADYIKYITR